jgi:hypothetical protein
MPSGDRVHVEHHSGTAGPMGLGFLRGRRCDGVKAVTAWMQGGMDTYRPGVRPVRQADEALLVWAKVGSSGGDPWIERSGRRQASRAPRPCTWRLLFFEKCL